MSRLLLDNCIGRTAWQALLAKGHDVVWMAEFGADPGDEAVLARAQADTRILCTLDKDFGELVHLRGLPHAGIVRLTPCPPAIQAARIDAVLVVHEADLLRGALVVISDHRVRIRVPLVP